MGQERRILFVCHGNIFRSAFAHRRLEGMLEAQGMSGYEVRSAGTRAKPGDASAPVVVEVAREYGVDLSRHRATPISKALVDWAGRVYAMEYDMRADILSLRPGAGRKVWLLGALGNREPVEIADIGSAPDVEAVVRNRFDRIDSLLERLLARLKEEVS